MRQKAITDLEQLSDKEFFLEVSQGLELILENSLVIESNTKYLEKQKKVRGARILRAIAEEEASKFLILIDAVRCPKKPEEIFSRQLKRFNEHLAKGIYVRSCYWRHGWFNEIQEAIDLERKEYYLDGPLDVDWIFRNEILSRRESILYVDYIEFEGKHKWQSPTESDKVIEDVFGLAKSTIFSLILAMKDSGLTNPESLSIIAKKWRKLKMTEEYQWKDLSKEIDETLTELKNAGLLVHKPEGCYKIIKDNWYYPLYSLDLKIEEVKQSDLREIRKNWSPGF